MVFPEEVVPDKFHCGLNVKEKHGTATAKYMYTSDSGNHLTLTLWNPKCSHPMGYRINITRVIWAVLYYMSSNYISRHTMRCISHNSMHWPSPREAETHHHNLIMHKLGSFPYIHTRSFLMLFSYCMVAAIRKLWKQVVNLFWIYHWTDAVSAFTKVYTFSNDQCQNQWRNEVLGNVQFPNTQWR